MTKNIEICKAEEVGAQVLDIRTTAERQAVAAINAAFGLAIPLPANEPGEITELPAAVSAHDRQLLAQLLGKPEPAATLSTTDPLATFVATLTRELYRHLADRQAVYPLADFPAWFPHDDRNLAHLLQAVQSLSPRKISNGGATNDGIADGESLVRLLCDTTTASQVTELIDDRSWGEYLRDAQSDITSKFPNLDKLTFGARVIRINSKYIVLFNKNLSYLYFPYLEKFYGVMTSTDWNGSITNSSAITKLEMPELKRIDVQYSELGPISRQYAVQVARGCTSLREVLMPSLTYMPPNLMTSYENYMFTSCPNIERMVFGKLTAFNPWITQYAADTPMAKLIDIEFGEGVAINLNLAYWNPTNAMRSDVNDLVPSGSTAQNNLQQFLQNFRDHIALRLTNQGSGLTLTLSQAVRNAIHAAESTYGIEDIIVNQKHWTLSPAPSA